jgi:hypothetical protein
MKQPKVGGKIYSLMSLNIPGSLLNISCYGFFEGDARREIFHERQTRVHFQVIWMKSNLRKSKNPKVKLIF